MSKLNTRLEKLETKLRAIAKQSIWIDLFDNRVRIDIDGKRGEELTFKNVYDCVMWVEKQIIQFEKVTGFAYFSDISKLFAEGVPRNSFNYVSKDTPIKSVVINLNSLNGSNNSIFSVAFVSWQHSLTGVAYQDWWKEVLVRVNTLSESLDDDEDLDID